MSYPKKGRRFSSAENVREYRTFAETMRSADSSIQLIGWGDQERKQRQVVGRGFLANLETLSTWWRFT